MALTLTHLRFARDIIGFLQVEDRNAYYSGVVYPDSRILTGVPRVRTHGEGNPVDPFVPGLSDFEKGWAAHEFYDRRSHPWYFRLSPWPVDHEDKQRKWWRYITAIKTIEDMQSYEAVREEDFFSSMPVPRPPRGEDPALLEKFFRLNAVLYSHQPNPDAYDRLRAGCLMSVEMIAGINEYVTKILDEPGEAAKIAVIYPTVLEQTSAANRGRPNMVK